LTNSFLVLIFNSVFVFERLTDPDIELIVLNGIHRVYREDRKPVNIGQTEPDDVFSDPIVPSSQDTSSSRDTSVQKSLPQLSEKVLASLVSLADGDARTALSLLALVLGSSPETDEGSLLTALRQSVSTSYDRTGDSHYDMISALHKSVRGSEGSAAMYWLARMLTAGEDPVYIARRMVVCASEDIGLADNAALPLVSAPLFRPLSLSLKL
jgi:putative ATPase